MIDLYQLKPGDRVRLAEQLVGEVVTETEDGRWIKVRYVESPSDPALVGTEDLCSAEEIEERVTVRRR